MSTAHADQHEHEQDSEDAGVILSPEEEAALVQRLAKTDASEKAGRLIPWDALRVERGM